MLVLVLTNICFQIDNIPTNKYFRIHVNTNINTSIKNMPNTYTNTAFKNEH